MLSLSLIGALALTACPPPSGGTAGGASGGKVEKEKDGEDAAREKPAVKRGPPPPIEAQREINALKAEVASLQRELAEGKKPSPYVGLINAHEHLYKLKDLERYLPSARKAGITTTVIVASPKFTLEGKGEDKGEPSASENFRDVVLEAAKLYPGEIIPFCTIDPKDPEKLERLKKHVEMGAKGIKIYTGHSNYFDGSLDPPDMEPVWDYLEQTQLPVNWHVNLAKFMADFERVMKKHPKLNMMVPHYGVVFWKPDGPATAKLKELMRMYPNFYVDTSLGTREILLDGMAVMEQNRQIFVDFFKEFPNQIVWGTDSVITGNPEKTPGWYSKVIWATRDQLEKDVFHTELSAAYSKYWEKGRDGDGRYQGLALPEETLKKIYIENTKRWLRVP
jgi:predicted TIM-barrel fold metal-dependent hydrolase